MKFIAMERQMPPNYIPGSVAPFLTWGVGATNKAGTCYIIEIPAKWTCLKKSSS
ncbi:MAG: hypothetical protein IPL49_21130 [Saprospirales bacterium]|nr:hypothetical protein [Saprospirales bacterium]MBK8493310.1 hypothetical protein [Saprospirales bacterium]